MLLILLAVLAADHDPAIHVDPAEVRSSREFRAIAFTVHYCLVKEKEQQWLREIKDEKKEAKIAGVVNLASLKWKQDEVVVRREYLKAYLGELKKLGAKKAPDCKNKFVRQMQSCVDDDQSDGCVGPDMDAFRELIVQTEVEDWKQWRRDNGIFTPY